MNRLVRDLVMCAAVAGCTGSTATPSASSGLETQPISQRPTASPAVTPTLARAVTGLVAYQDGLGTWVVNADGTDPHLLLADAGPVAWSGDGSRLLVRSSKGLAVTDAAGTPPDQWYELRCPQADQADALDLAFCRPRTAAIAAFSPDGTRLAYVIDEGTHDQSSRVITSSIVVLDLSTGRITKLESTRTTKPIEGCGATADQGENGPPVWSPDGSRLGFARGSVGPSTNGECHTSTLTVAADGSDLRWITPRGGMDGGWPSWSPDGSTILFVSSDGTYLARPDGTGLLRVSGDRAWGWTRDGRIVFIRWTVKGGDGRGDRGDLWVMDADGGNARQLEATIPALTAAGCIVCPYPVAPHADGSSIDPLVARQTPALEQFWLITMLWQPDATSRP